MTAPTDWIPARLGDIAAPRRELLAPQNLGQGRYVALEHIDAGCTTLARWSNPLGVRSAKSKFQAGDILYGKLRPYLDKAALAPWDGVCSTEILPLAAAPTADPAFTSLILHTRRFIDHATATTVGVNHPRTSWAALSAFELHLPSLAEQRRIAAFLTKLQRRVETERERARALAALKSATLAKLFREGLRGEPLKDSPIGPIPTSWTCETIGNCARVISTRLTYEDLRRQPACRTATQVTVLGIKVSDMNTEGNETEVVRAALSAPVAEGLAATACAPPGTVIFPKRGAAIATNKKRLTAAWSVFDPNVIGIRPDNLVDPRFLFQYFLTIDLRALTDPGPTPQLNKKDLIPLRIPVPPISEQREIATQLDLLDRRLAATTRLRTARSSIFRATLERLMTGELRLPAGPEEVAEAANA